MVVKMIILPSITAHVYQDAVSIFTFNNGITSNVDYKMIFDFTLYYHEKKKKLPGRVEHSK